MSHMKGINPKYGVFNYTCSDHSCARSLYESQRLKVTNTFSQKRTPYQLLKRCSLVNSMDSGTPNSQKLGTTLFTINVIFLNDNLIIEKFTHLVNYIL